MKHPVRFITIALIWAFSFWGLNVLFGLGTRTVSGLALIILGGASPLIAALFLVFSSGGKKLVRVFLTGLWDYRRIDLIYWAAAVILPLLILGFSIFATQMLYPDSNAFVVSKDLPGSFLTVLLFALAVLIMGPLPEEIGWRGYLLPALARSVNLLMASIIIAVVWGLWHLPLFFIDGYPLSEKLAEPLSLFAYFALLFPKSIVYTWLFYKTRRSILAVVIFHFFINLYGMIWDTTLNAELAELGFWTLTAAWMVILNPILFKRVLS